jgi:hypothetical protein
MLSLRVHAAHALRAAPTISASVAFLRRLRKYQQLLQRM